MDYFSNMNNIELRSCYEQYMKWKKDGSIGEQPLRDVIDKVSESSFMENPLLIVQTLLLNEIADRWYTIHTTREFVCKDDNEDKKKKALIKNVKTFIRRTMKYDCDKTLYYLKSKNAPIDSSDNVEDMSEFNEYLNDCDIEELETLKKGLASINEFSTNLVNAIRKEK